MKHLTRAVIALAPMALLAGCGSTNTPAAALPALSGPVPVVTTLEQVNRPIDPYIPTPSEVLALIAAANVLNARCMAAFGLHGSDTHATDVDAHGVRVAIAHTHLYGFFDPSVAATDGYDVVQLQSSQVPGQPAAAPVSPAALSVESGQDDAGHPVADYAGKPVPAHGCKAQAQTGIGGEYPDMSAAGLPDGGPVTPLSDPRVLAANKQWSACMKGKGYHFATPYEAMDSATAQDAQVVGPEGDRKVVHSPAEIAQATADVGCKQATNFMGTATAVQDAYDRQYIAGHGPALAEYRRQLDDRVHAAQQIVASSGAPPSD
ncbi:hypothetical protein KGQ20_06000 [Catenulispora sp. NF23]|uniref:Lipoprotein n=1 Tax=Catenulispora pinistramenti TaxID=2705254 RepID=A0ABS5KIF3_9ACTN|nr:hypothetical protein [Catenulispora pinistramenti]MBS2532320.1 hypothetical protein [Catenulispora pinistramenti]MBS2546089.1 hypothetical protein [Catenulispora pinistramenti]